MVFRKLYVDVSMMVFHYTKLRGKFPSSWYEVRNVIRLDRL